MSTRALTLAFVLVAAAVPAPAETVHVDFSSPQGTVHFAYGANELLDKFCFNNYGKQFSREVGHTLIRVWVDGVMYAQGFAQSPANMNWAWLDAPVYDTLAAGAVPMICVAGPPPYLAVDGNTSGHGRPSDYAAFGQFFVAIAQHYANAGQPVHTWYYEVWNEPNNTEVSGPMPAGTYIDIFRHVHQAMKAADARYRVGGPSTDGAPSTYLNGVLDNGGEFITWHRYGAWDPSLRYEDRVYLDGTPSYQTIAASVRDRIAGRRPGEEIPQLCGEINWNGSYAPIDPRIWQIVNVPFYLSVITHLIRGGCSGEMIYTGSDSEQQMFGMWLTRGPNAGRRSPLYWGKRLWTGHIASGATRVAANDLANLEVTAVSHGAKRAVALVHKASTARTVTVQLAGAPALHGVLRAVDTASYAAGGIRETELAPATAYDVTLAGYGISVLAFDADAPTPTPTPVPALLMIW